MGWVQPRGVATATAPMAAWERSAGSGTASDRFTWDRRNAALSVRSPAALTATGEWPVAPRPAERRILFRRFVQR